MRTIWTIVVLCALHECSSQSAKGKVEEKQTEQDIRDAFTSAFSNRSEEVGQFFNQTFGPGGNASEIADRFKTAWQGASEGVKRFVNETYWNISKTIQGENATSSGMELLDVSAAVSRYAATAPKEPTPRTKSDETLKQRAPSDETSTEHHSVLDSAWNYFKSVFGVNPDKAKPVPSVAPKHHPEASIPEPATSSHSGLYLGLIMMMAGGALVLQTTMNRNSLVNKNLYTRKQEVPSGYVRIA